MDRNSDASRQRLLGGRRLLEEAAALAELCAGHWHDEEAVQDERERIHYAVDTNLIVMYAQPQRDSYRIPQTFSGAVDVHERVVALVGDLVMRRLDARTADASLSAARSPLVALPPHDEESKRVVLAISRDVAAQVKNQSGRLDALKNMLSEAVAGATGAEARSRLLRALETEAPVFAGFLNSSLPTELLRLLPRGRLLPPAFHPAFGEEAQYLHRPQQRLLNGRLEELSGDAKNWFTELTRGAREIDPSSAHKLWDDAWALAYLQWVNQDAWKRNLKQRLVLITASELNLAASKAFPAFHEGFRNFADAYLRDARALLGTKHCFAPLQTSDTQFRMLEFLSVLFPNAVLQARSPRPQGGITVDVNVGDAHKLAGSAEIDEALNVVVSAGHRASHDAKFPDADLNKWRVVVTDSLAQIVVGRRREADLPGLEGHDIDVQSFLDALVRRVQSSFADLYLTMGVIGIEQLLDANHKVRGLPALRFDDRYPRAQAQAAALSDLMFSKSRTMHFDLAKLYDDLRIEDDSNYHAHVMHAFVYASSGKWFQARTLCRVALTVVEAIPESRRAGRLGREAAYLMAVAERRLAGKASKLELAREALKLARERCSADEGSDVRFDSESFAQDMTELQLHYFEGGVDLVDVGRFAARAHELADRVDQPREKVECVRHWVIRQSVTNGLIASLFAALRGQRFAQEVGSIRKLLARLSDEGLAPVPDGADADHPYPDEVSDFVWLVAAAHFGDPHLRAIARERIGAMPVETSDSPTLLLEQKRRNALLGLVGLGPAGVERSKVVTAFGALLPR